MDREIGVIFFLACYGLGMIVGAVIGHWFCAKRAKEVIAESVRFLTADNNALRDNLRIAGEELLSAYDEIADLRVKKNGTNVLYPDFH